MRSVNYKSAILIFALTGIIVSGVAVYVVVERKITRFTSAVGMSKESVRDIFGDPDWVIPPSESRPDEAWVYYVGPFGGGACLQFNSDHVDEVITRKMK